MLAFLLLTSCTPYTNIFCEGESCTETDALETTDGDETDTDSGADDTEDSQEDTSEPSDDTWCWTTRPMENGRLLIYTVNIPSGEMSEYGYVGQDIDFTYYTRGLALVESELILAANHTGAKYLKIDLIDGTSSWGESSNLALSVTWTGEYLVKGTDSFGKITAFESWEDLNSDSPAFTIDSSARSYVYGVDENGLIYGNKGASEMVDIYEESWQVTGEYHSVELEGYDSHVWGLHIHKDIIYLLSNSHEIISFDLRTGAQLGKVTLNQSTYGLWCGSGEPPSF